MSEEVNIDRHFRGPPDSANGGYACGVLAEHVAGSPGVEVTLRSPPPLDKPLSIDGDGDGAALRDGETLVATARAAAEPELELPDPVSLDQAEAARSDSFLRAGSPFPECFVCGPDREGRDGLGIVCGLVEGRELVAAPWEGSDQSPAGEVLDPRLVWSALDCPGGIVVMVDPELGVCMLGRLTASLLKPIESGQTHVAIGWPIDRDGRKFFSGSAIIDQAGEPLAVARATWIELRDQAPGDGAA